MQENKSFIDKGVMLTWITNYYYEYDYYCYIYLVVLLQISVIQNKISFISREQQNWSI